MTEGFRSYFFGIILSQHLYIVLAYLIDKYYLF